MYSPKLKPEQVKKLYQLKKELKKYDCGKPTLVDLVRQAVDEYLERAYCKKCGGLLIEHGFCVKCDKFDDGEL